MRTPSLRHLLLTSLILVGAGACRGGDDTPGDDESPDAPPNVNDATIYDIQQGVIPENTVVTINGVVVTAIDTYAERADGTRVGNIWIQEPAGGAYSGILVFGAPAAVVDDLVVGDVVNVAGASITEFAFNPGLPGGEQTPRRTTELQPGDAGVIEVTRVSSGAPPEPEPVDALAIARMDDHGDRPTARDNEWEKWEGVLIRIENVTQRNEAQEISGEANFLGFGLNGGLETDTSLAPFPTGVAANGCIASITGIGDYFFNYKILARETSEMVLNGTGCAPAEEGDSACSDGEDNDSNGWADCEDRSCQLSAPACVTATTATAVQMGTVVGAVTLENVFVTGVTFNRSNLYVQDALAAAPYNGVYVFRGGSSVEDLPPEIEPGAVVDIAGIVTEFQGYTEITNPTVTFVSAPTGQPTPIATDIATLLDPAMAEPYEGVYVRLSNAEVTEAVEAGGPMGFDYYYLLAQGASSIYADDDIHRGSPDVGDCFATIAGIFGYNQFTSPVPAHVNLLPTKAADLVTGGTCP
jgi:hypothetical protein